RQIRVRPGFAHVARTGRRPGARARRASATRCEYRGHAAIPLHPSKRPAGHGPGGGAARAVAGSRTGRPHEARTSNDANDCQGRSKMSYFLDRLRFFRRNPEPFAEGHGFTKTESRDWEDSYRARWQYDKIVRSTHGVNCTGSCSWKIYVKNGLVTWETQQTDYPRTRPDLPNHEPRGCPRGASYSWYLYSANRLKYPLVRG